MASAQQKVACYSTTGGQVWQKNKAQAQSAYFTCASCLCKMRAKAFREQIGVSLIAKWRLLPYSKLHGTYRKRADGTNRLHRGHYLRARAGAHYHLRHLFQLAGADGGLVQFRPGIHLNIAFVADPARAAQG